MSEHSTAAEVSYKEIPGFPAYRVGSDGSFWTCFAQGGFAPGRPRVPLPARLTTSWRRLKAHAARSGHLQVTLCANGSRSQVSVHVAVLTAFVGSPPPGMECCHNDGDPANNKIENLRWDTPTGNARDRVKHGKQPRGTMIYGAKLDADKVREIRRLCAEGVPVLEVARSFGVREGTVWFIRAGKTWRHVV